jgi:hypothetical protein
MHQKSSFACQRQATVVAVTAAAMAVTVAVVAVTAAAVVPQQLR